MLFKSYQSWRIRKHWGTITHWKRLRRHNKREYGILDWMLQRKGASTGLRLRVNAMWSRRRQREKLSFWSEESEDIVQGHHSYWKGSGGIPQRRMPESGNQHPVYGWLSPSQQLTPGPHCKEQAPGNDKGLQLSFELLHKRSSLRLNTLQVSFC